MKMSQELKSECLGRWQARYERRDREGKKAGCWMICARTTVMSASMRSSCWAGFCPNRADVFILGRSGSMI